MHTENRPTTNSKPTLADLLTLERLSPPSTAILKLTLLVPTNKAVMALAKKPHQGMDDVDDGVEMLEGEFDSRLKSNVEHWFSVHVIPVRSTCLVYGDLHNVAYLYDAPISWDPEYETVLRGNLISFTPISMNDGKGPEWSRVTLEEGIRILDKRENLSNSRSVSHLPLVFSRKIEALPVPIEPQAVLDSCSTDCRPPSRTYNTTRYWRHFHAKHFPIDNHLLKVNNELDKVVCRLDIAIIKSSPGTNASLDLEIGWFRRLDKEVPIKARLGNKELKVQALIQAVERHLIRIAKAAQQLGSPELTLEQNNYTHPRPSSDSDVDSDADMELAY
ncbi:uncharacterized protein LACBIDRAFT_330594 [Laccaria bicolor S238N-H82]|uniref:Predicted protein n=1 Tax=Laccaria bicolor (strain S238N-H82 / ATCC MYA-4686) TaxID=486041 RepID=B0DLU4_LACBS|nr:uncharacterized protein LACBIDRAFT_330594 [Laccaria bicolor S238N-H82]EDR04457.1 predicted protein [Laccaria bicolor S238N-H82]|eukprot:XP_001884976.1 predicted protein [Laccaria bicolor S238N-H82]